MVNIQEFKYNFKNSHLLRSEKGSEEKKEVTFIVYYAKNFLV